MKYVPHNYQLHAEEHVIEHAGAGILMDMGLGKTVVMLTAISKLIECGEVRKVLVIGPKNVAEHVWTGEVEKWDHLKGITVSKVLGKEKQRKEALKAKADIYIINRENVVWLIAHLGGAFPFDMLVVDESSSFKNPSAARFKALRVVLPKIKRNVIMTGTPVPNGLLDLWPQIYILDRGKRLGETFTSYRNKYFKPGDRNGYIIYDYELKGKEKETRDLLGEDIYQKEIYEKIGDICISMKSEDWLELPERIDRIVPVHLSSKVRQQYEDFECEQVLALEDVEHISAVNAAALTNKLLQFSNGAVYDDTGKWHEVHTAKLEALEEIIESANGQPVLVLYSFIHDRERIMSRLKRYKPVEIRTKGSVDKWNRKEIPILLGHPASMGHGLNLQAGGNIIVWFSVPWSLELYQQANKRLHRQGQTQSVIIHHLVCPGTMDEDVLRAQDTKARSQEALLQAVKARIKKYTKSLVQ